MCATHASQSAKDVHVPAPTCPNRDKSSCSLEERELVKTLHGEYLITLTSTKRQQLNSCQQHAPTPHSLCTSWRRCHVWQATPQPMRLLYKSAAASCCSTPRICTGTLLPVAPRCPLSRRPPPRDTINQPTTAQQLAAQPPLAIWTAHSGGHPPSQAAAAAVAAPCRARCWRPVLLQPTPTQRLLLPAAAVAAAVAAAASGTPAADLYLMY
jgi:hypothetical protein